MLKSVAEAGGLTIDAGSKLQSATLERLDDISAVMRSVAEAFEHTDQANADRIAAAYEHGLPEWKAPKQ